jgi:L-seryl-tRNA(Ser) seleniumtransferase
MFCDAGSGLMLDLSEWGLTDEPVVSSLLEDGCDLVSFSGDKLLGGPQAGIVLGKEKIVELVKKHPLYRALRLDKTTLAALSATMRVYAYGSPLRDIPVLRMLCMQRNELEARAKQLAEKLCAASPQIEAEAIEGESCPGGGSFPTVSMKSAVVSLRLASMTASEVSSLLRAAEPPIISRLQGGLVIFDPRTLQDEDCEHIVRVLGTLASRYD